MRIRILATVFLAGIALIAADFAESTAEAGLLKNGVRPGNRSKMHIVRRPSQGTRKRIFAPGENRPSPSTGGKKRPKGAKRRYKQQHAWFWKLHSPTMGAAGPNRWKDTLATMSGRRAKGNGMVSNAKVTTVLEAYGDDISRAAKKHGVSEALLTAIIIVESAGKQKAVSHKGAQGLMQLIPATAKRFGVTDAFNAQQNIGGGAAYLNWLLKEFSRDPLLALAGYNAGEGAVRKHKGVPPFAETRDYVVKVMDAMAAMQTHCQAIVKGPRTSCPIQHKSAPPS